MSNMLSLFALEAKALSFKELWDKFYNSFISPDMAYENLDFSGVISIQWIIIGLFMGIAIAAVASVIGKRVFGSFVKKLIDGECLSPESAKTLPELDYADKLMIRYSVKRGVNLRRVVRCREEEEYEAENAEKALRYAEMRKENPRLPKKFTPKPFKIDPDKHHFYIPEELKYMAKVKFDQKGTSLRTTIVFVALILLGLLALILFLPNILNLIDNAAGLMK